MTIGSLPAPRCRDGALRVGHRNFIGTVHPRRPARCLAGVASIWCEASEFQPSRSTAVIEFHPVVYPSPARSGLPRFPSGLML